MEEALIALLLASAPVAALAGSRGNWGERPQKEPLPGFTLLIVSPGRGYVHGSPDALGNPRVQVDCYGTTFAQAKALARAIRDTLEAGGTQGSIRFTPSLLEAERGPMIEDVGGGRKAHRVSMDFFVWFSPAA